MSKKKGLSMEEKKQRMLQLFYEKKDFFQLKELEKLAPKEKGIIVQSVKDVVQTLVDDGLVDSEKIGTSIYFWAFPSKATHTKKRKLEEIEEKIESSNKMLKKCEQTFQEAKVGRDECSERDDVLKTNKELREENETLLTKIKAYKDSDPEAFEQMKKDIKSTIDLANNQTDNIFTFISWCKSKFGMEEETLYKQFEIPQDLDYLLEYK
ncbi:meiotic nuclear division protein 1 homolog [Halyomorpha halys]|uniref:meiotic nuclear division protein 1 homolog n=1 Tax=Halyomorpha halys TaxID=286706 RepID=UPI0006D4D9A3|nr:meiotic nuclear division protein 1 homolog [Halyomorpha halys]XP_014290201.1 meiotic nuclear division protein 1 homolog [Halyomorpha halys]XP_014290203.1 meiotic nuclear division protein 1 homolog [Halyomorpha halys]XP_014290204.1 meiotic nuclear division protein 1 homolog [Halyomorpha halys]XP_014290205.1 meiotic nuclear division protein 1 homolog [Halyomorpha halys]